MYGCHGACYLARISAMNRLPRISPLASLISCILTMAAVNVAAAQAAQDRLDACRGPAATAGDPRPISSRRSWYSAAAWSCSVRADAASEGTVGGADLLVRPMLRTAELLEVVPGLVAVQHSGSGKANQYFLRGFNLDHGTDFTAYVDGMPWNLRSHGHGQGYLDVNGMMPEVVERIDYRKGPYRADLGDFSMAGASFISTIDRLDAPFVGFEAGQYGWGRLAAGGTKELANDALLTGLVEHKSYDGPWHQPEASCATRRCSASTSGRRSSASWPSRCGATTAIGTRRSRSPSVRSARSCAPTRSARSTRRPTATRRAGSATVQLDGDEVARVGVRAVLRLVHAVRTRLTTSRSTSSTAARRSAAATRARSSSATSSSSKWAASSATTTSVTSVSITTTRAISSRTFRKTRFASRRSAGFAEATWSPTEKLRLMGGVRSDFYTFDVTAKTPGSFAGHTSESLTSPKVGLAWALNKKSRVLRQLGARIPFERRARRREHDVPRAGAVAGHRLRDRGAVRGRRAEAHDCVLVARPRQRADLRRRLELRRAERRVAAQRLRAHVVLAADRLARHRRRVHRQQSALRRQPRRSVHRGLGRAFGPNWHLGGQESLGGEFADSLPRRVPADARQRTPRRRRHRRSACAARTRSVA